MSMKVDFSTPLTDEERAYLELRGQYADIQRADQLTGVTDAPEYGAGDGTGLQQVSLMTSEQRATEAERLRARLAQIEGTDGADSQDGADDSLLPYEEWKLDDLKAEIDLRNDGRPADQKMVKTGKVADLAARLREDDAQAV